MTKDKALQIVLSLAEDVACNLEEDNEPELRGEIKKYWKAIDIVKEIKKEYEYIITDKSKAI